MDTYSYLDSLPLTGEEKIKITNQGYDSAVCLYSIIKDSGGDVVWKWLGRDMSAELIPALERLLTAEELVKLNKPVLEYSLGSIVPDAVMSKTFEEVKEIQERFIK